MEEKVTLWTLQGKDVYDKLMRDGIYCKSDDAICVEEFSEPYRYMVRQMTERIGPPGFPNARWPVWAWRFYKDEQHPKPRRTYDFLGSEQDEMVFMELRIDNSRILESRFGLWHFVLNGMPINEDDTIDAETSWEKIFDKEFEDEYLGARKWGEECWQACFWTLQKEDIVSADLLQKQQGTRALKVRRLYGSKV